MSVTLKGLAAHLGLTVSTVSRALNGYSDIAPATRERVRAAADELGYQVNQNARRLSIGTPETIAYLMPKQLGNNIQPFIAELVGGLSDALGKRNWDLIVSKEEAPTADLEKLRHMVRSGRVAGIVLSRPLKNDPRIALLQQLNCPFVVHGRTDASDGYAWYDVDGKSAFVEAVNHLVQLGHRRIGFVGSPLQYEFSQQRLDGYHQGLSLNGLKADAELVQIADMSDHGGEIAAGILLNLQEPPTALVCVSDVMALGTLAALRARDLQPGQDVSVIGYDGLHFGVHSNPPLTTMAQPQAHAGRRLGDMLLAVIDGADPKSQQELQRAQLVRRKSDGPPPNVGAQLFVSDREEIS